MGGAGSGKTTLAREISARLGCPCYHLDQIGWGLEGKRSLASRLADVEQIVVQPAWVSEGAFLWWTDSLMKTADVIVWLDLPFRINAWRMVKRHALLSLAGTNPHPGLRNLLSFMWYVYKRYKAAIPLVPNAPDDDAATTRIATEQVLSGYADKLVRCLAPRDVKTFLNGVPFVPQDT
jgi:shikimate kinase